MLGQRGSIWMGRGPGAPRTLMARPASSSLSGNSVQPAGPWSGTGRKLPTWPGPAGAEDWHLGSTGAAQIDAWEVADDPGPQGSTTHPRGSLRGELSPEQRVSRALAV